MVPGINFAQHSVADRINALKSQGAYVEAGIGTIEN